MKLSLALSAIICGASIPTIYSLGISESGFGAVGLKSYYSHPNTIQSLSEFNLFQAIDEKSLSRRRAELTISQECYDGTLQIKSEDPRYNATSGPLYAACPTRRAANQDGTLIAVVDQRECAEGSEFVAFCDANYQSIKIPDFKVACPATEDFPNPILQYNYGFVECLDPSCPLELSPEDILRFLGGNDNSTTGCILEFLEEGEEPQIEAEVIVPDNFSEECIDQIDNERILFTADEEYVTIRSSEPPCLSEQIWMSGNDTIVLLKVTGCDGGKEFNEQIEAFCDAQPNYQYLKFGPVKHTCAGLSSGGAGDVIAYRESFERCAGLSCPANPADWSISDMKYSAFSSPVDSCEWELIGAEDLPEPPALDDATSAPEDETGDIDASVASEDEVSASLEDDSSASRFVASMAIALPLAAAFRLL